MPNDCDGGQRGTVKEQQFCTQRSHPRLNPHFAVGRTCAIAPGIRNLNCAGPGMASKSVPEAPEGGVRRRSCVEIPRPPTRAGIGG
eukprot:1146379-Alexandrium_andersonii.AAC.1